MAYENTDRHDQYDSLGALLARWDARLGPVSEAAARAAAEAFDRLDAP